MILNNEAVEVLKKEVESNPAANAVFHVFALRRRTRAQITMHGLSQRMKLEGFEYRSDQYAHVLKLLAKLGLGKLEVDSKGRVRALKEVKATLQSIGVVACGDKSTVKVYNKRNKFMKVYSNPAPETPKQQENSPKPELVPDSSNNVIILSVPIKHKYIDISVPKDLNAEEIAALIYKFQK